MKQVQAQPVTLPGAAGAPPEAAAPPMAAAGVPGTVAGAPLAIELRHLRYFVALADAGSFTHAAERIFIAQPTLSQQIRRLEQIVGTPLLHRRRDGLRLTMAGAVLLDASRTVLSLVDHEVNRTRQAAGLGRPRLRVVVPPDLPDALAVQAARGAAIGGGRGGCGDRLGGGPARCRVLADRAATGRRRAGLAHS
jgi:Bacterial regulatory helix-turn-helix protein, lysR family